MRRRDRARDEQDVGVARGGDDFKAGARDVVEGIARRAELVLTAVAGAGVDVPERE